MRGTVCLLFILVVALLQNVLSASNNAFQPMIGAVVSAVNTPTCLLVTSQHGYVSCLSQSSGELSWRLKIGDNVSSVLSYVAHDGLVLLATLNNKRIMISGVTIDSGFIQWEFSLEGPYESQFELSSQFDARNKLWYLLVDNTSIYVVDVANKSQHGTFKFPDTKLRLDKISLNAKNQIVTAGCLLTSASPAICQHNVLMTLPIQAGQPMTSKDIANAKFSVFSEVQKLGEYQLFQSSQGPGIVSSSKKLSADGNELTLSLAYLFVEEGKIHTCSKVVDLSQFDDKRFSIEVLTVKESVTLLILVEHSAGSTTIQYKLDYVQNTLLEGPTKKCRNCNIIVVKDYSLTNVQNLESFQLVETQHIYHESMQLSTSAIVKLELGHYLLAFKNGLTFLVDGQNLHKVMWHRYDGLSNIKQAVALGITTEIGETDEVRPFRC